MKLISLVVLAWLLLVVACLADFHPSAVCRIRCDDGNGTTSLGSGVLIEYEGQQFVLTNAHVVSDRRNERSVEIVWPSVGLRRGGLVLMTRKNNEGDDTAVLAIEGGPVPIEAATLGERIDGEAAIYGFGGQGQFAHSRGRIRPLAVWYELDQPVRQGDSGGPLVANGCVVGLVWGSDASSSMAVRVGPIRRLLHTVVDGLAGRPLPVQYRMCPPGQVCPPVNQPPSRLGRVVGMQPLPQPPAEPRPVTPVPRESDCEGCDERLAALESSVDKLANLTNDLTGNTIEKLDQLDHEIDANQAAGVSRFADLENQITLINENNQQLDKRVAAKPDSSRLDELERRIAEQEQREITLEAYSGGELVGKSTGKRILRFDVQTLTGEE